MPSGDLFNLFIMLPAYITYTGDFKGERLVLLPIYEKEARTLYADRVNVYLQESTRDPFDDHYPLAAITMQYDKPTGVKTFTTSMVFIRDHDFVLSAEAIVQQHFDDDVKKFAATLKQDEIVHFYKKV